MFCSRSLTFAVFSILLLASCGLVQAATGLPL